MQLLNVKLVVHHVPVGFKRFTFEMRCISYPPAMIHSSSIQSYLDWSRKKGKMYETVHNACFVQCPTTAWVSGPSVVLRNFQSLYQCCLHLPSTDSLWENVHFRWYLKDIWSLHLKLLTGDHPNCRYNLKQNRYSNRVCIEYERQPLMLKQLAQWHGKLFVYCVWHWM